MENLKNLLGEKFKEDITVEEIEQALTGMKLKDVSKGDYVAKGKYEDALKKAEDATNELATFKAEFDKNKAELDEMKPKFESYVAKEKKDNLFAKAKSFKIAPEFIEYATDKLGEDGDYETFAKEHPQYCEKDPPIVVDSNGSNKSSQSGKDEFEDFRNVKI